MKKLLLYALMFFVMLSVPGYAQMSAGMMGEQECEMWPQVMMGEGQQMPMMNCPMMEEMCGQGMMQSGQMMGQGMMGGMMGMARERMGRFNPWFQYGVTLMLQNANRLGLSDEQKKRLDEIRRRYSKDIIRQEAELKIAEIDLESLLKESEMNLPKVKEALKKIEGIGTQIRYLRIEALSEARKILTDEQRKNLRKIMETPVPMMRGMMGSPAEPEKEEQKKEGVQKEEVPKTDPHGH